MITSEWIEAQIRFLNIRLGLFKLSAGQEFFYDPTPGFYGFISQGSVSALNEAMRMLSDFVLAPSSPVIEEWEGPANPLVLRDYEWSNQKDPPGLIRYDGPLRSRIQIAITNKHTPFIMGAILAHELIHHVLANKDIGYPNVEENERFTDFATVFLGLGKLTLNGYEPIEWSISKLDKTSTYTYQVGYLSSPEIADVFQCICDFRSIAPQEVQSNLTPVARNHLDASIRNERQRKCQKEKINRREQRKAKWRNWWNRLFGNRIRYSQSIPSTVQSQHADVNKRIIECSKCGQKLRVPNSTQIGHVTCPSCREYLRIAPSE